MAKEMFVAQRVSVPENSFGLPTLVGKMVLVFTTTYIYFGRLLAVNGEFVEIGEPHIVYETGPFTAKTFTDAQKVSETLFLSIGHIESAFATEKTPNAK